MADEKMEHLAIKEKLRELTKSIGKNRPLKGVVRPYPEILNLYKRYLAIEREASPYKTTDKIQMELAAFCGMSNSCLQNYARMTRLVPELLQNIGRTISGHAFSVQSAATLCSYPPELQMDIVQEVILESELRGETFWLTLWKYNHTHKKNLKNKRIKPKVTTVTYHKENITPQNVAIMKYNTAALNAEEVAQDVLRLNERAQVTHTIESLNVRAAPKDWSSTKTVTIPQPKKWSGEQRKVSGQKY